MNRKLAFILLTAAIAAAVFECGSNVANAQQTGSVQLLNVIGERVIIQLCVGPSNDRRGPGFVDGFEYWTFPVNVLSQGWTCSFEWTNSAEGGRKHTAKVRVWQGMLGASNIPESSLIDIDTVPCINCLWKIQRDGFYRADNNNHANFQFMARWN